MRWIRTIALGMLLATFGNSSADPPAADAPVPQTPIVVIEPPQPPGTVSATEPPTVATTPEPDISRIPGSIRDSGEYLLWWMKSGPLPPLATRANGAAPVIGQPRTHDLFGGTIDLDERSGGRFVTSLFAGNERTTGIEGGYWFLGSRTSTLLAAGNTDPGGPIIGRPFADAVTGRESFVPIAAPGFQAGELRVAETARAQGAEVNLVANVIMGGRWQIDGLLGYRFVNLHEGLNLTQLGVMPGTLADLRPTQFTRADDFDCDNRYHGGQIGLRGEVRKGPAFAELTGKVAFGQVTEVVRVSGVTGVVRPGQEQTIKPGGLLALDTNSGRMSREAFAVLPEAIVRAGWALGNHARLFVGYDFLYLSDVARPGDQIDRTINVSRVPFMTGINLPGGPERPVLAIHHSNVWLQGMLLGFEGKW